MPYGGARATEGGGNELGAERFWQNEAGEQEVMDRVLHWALEPESCWQSEACELEVDVAIVISGGGFQFLFICDEASRLLVGLPCRRR